MTFSSLLSKIFFPVGPIELDHGQRSRFLSKQSLVSVAGYSVRSIMVNPIISSLFFFVCSQCFFFHNGADPTCGLVTGSVMKVIICFTVLLAMNLPLCGAEWES